jgi:geranylgeranylglycerol-phosphate geranylgeranyltransferase
MIGFAVLVGIIITNPSLVFSEFSFVGFLIGFFISSYSMVINDIYDIDIDKINRPDRPLPSGRVTLNEAKLFSVFLLFIGISLSIISIIRYDSSILIFFITIFFSFISWLYSYGLKKRGLIGNFIVAISMTIPFIFGGIIINGFTNVLLLSFSTIAFLSGLGREIVKTICDVKGDKSKHVNTVSITLGVSNAAKLGGFLILCAVLVSIIPFVLGSVDPIYFIFLILPNSLMLYSSLKIIFDHSESSAYRIKNLLLMGMLLGLLGFLLIGIAVS